MNTTNHKNFVSPSMSAGDFVRDKPCLCFQPNDPVCEIIEKMKESHSYAVAITEYQRLAGLLTGQDILIRAASWQMQRPPSMESVAKAFNAMKAADVMILNPITVSSETPLDEAMRIISGNGFRYIPVLKNDYPLGILNVLDVMKYMEEKERHDNETKDEVLSYMMNHENYGCVSKN